MTATTELLPNYLDVTRLAIASFLARYRERPLKHRTSRPTSDGVSTTTSRCCVSRAANSRCTSGRWRAVGAPPRPLPVASAQSPLSSRPTRQINPQQQPLPGELTRH